MKTLPGIADEDVEYQPLRLSTEDLLADETRRSSKLPDSHYGRRRTLAEKRDYGVPFIISSVVATGLGIVCLILWRRLALGGACFSSTDFPDARRTIEYERRVFTGDIKIDWETREIYHEVPKGEKRWFGDPKIYPEIDRNWKDLLGYEFITLKASEAVPFYGDNFIQMPIDGKYHASLAVIHGLHCLNAVRIHLDKDYYLKHGGLHQDGLGYPANFTRTHLSHCLDQIRQMITCSSDLSPVPVKVNKDIRVNGEPLFIASGAAHTCRKFDNVVEWLKERKSTIGAFGEYAHSKPINAIDYPVRPQIKRPVADGS